MIRANIQGTERTNSVNVESLLTNITSNAPSSLLYTFSSLGVNARHGPHLEVQKCKFVSYNRRKVDAQN